LITNFVQKNFEHYQIHQRVNQHFLFSFTRISQLSNKPTIPNNICIKLKKQIILSTSFGIGGQKLHILVHSFITVESHKTHTGLWVEIFCEKCGLFAFVNLALNRFHYCAQGLFPSTRAWRKVLKNKRLPRKHADSNLEFNKRSIQMFVHNSKLRRLVLGQTSW
jgi:hypothetical protein